MGAEGHLTSASRRVHISQNTMDCLKGEFEVEPGDGGSRCDYLKEKGIVTYLVLVPKQPLKNGINGVVSHRPPPPPPPSPPAAFSSCLDHRHCAPARTVLPLPRPFPFLQRETPSLSLALRLWTRTPLHVPMMLLQEQDPALLVRVHNWDGSSGYFSAMYLVLRDQPGS